MKNGTSAEFSLRAKDCQDNVAPVGVVREPSTGSLTAMPAALRRLRNSALSFDDTAQPIGVRVFIFFRSASSPLEQ